MADTIVSPNNRTIVFRGKPQKEQAMPSVSRAQDRAMHAAEEGKSTLGIPARVGKEFTQAQEPGSVKNLPEHVGKKLPSGAAKKRVDSLRKRGLISDKEHSKRFGG